MCDDCIEPKFHAWKFKFVPNPIEWCFGHKRLSTYSGHELLEAWCFGPIEWKRWIK